MHSWRFAKCKETESRYTYFKRWSFNRLPSGKILKSGYNRQVYSLCNSKTRTIHTDEIQDNDFESHEATKGKYNLRMNKAMGRKTKKGWRVLLLESQRQSTMKDALLKIRIRMIISKL